LFLCWFYINENYFKDFNMPKVLQINSCVNRGSTGRIAEDIGVLLQKNGWESHIAYGKKSNNSKSNLLKIGTNFDIITHGFYTRILDYHGLASTKATRIFVDDIEAIQPDIVHLHNIHGYYLNYPLLFDYLRESGVPVVWTFHDCWSFTGHCAYFDMVGCEKWMSECNKCPQKSTYPSSLLFDNSKKSYNIKKKHFNSLKSLTIVPVSEWLVDITKKSFLGSNSIKCIHNGIDTEVFSISESNLRTEYNLENRFVLLGVATPWSERKGLRDILELRKQLSDKYAIVLIGLSKKQIKQLPEGIVGIERTDSTKELAQWYSLTDVFINPTYEDNFPTTNLEAMACGTPVITYRTGGSGESITKNTGLIVDKGDLKGLINAIKHIKNNSNDFSSENCRDNVVCNYNKNERYMEYFKLYKKLLKK